MPHGIIPYRRRDRSRDPGRDPGRKEMNDKITFDNTVSLLNSLPALTFSKDAETGRYLACSQSFAEYAHKQSPERV